MSFNPNVRGDAGRPIFSPAIEALATIGTKSAARTVAGRILDPSGKPIEILKRMGPVAELPMIELILDETGGNAEPRLACEVLAEIGGLRSVPALRRTTQGWRAQSHAREAMEAIAKRQGLSVEELLTKAQSMTPATVANPIAASSSGHPHLVRRHGAIRGRSSDGERCRRHRQPEEAGRRDDRRAPGSPQPGRLRLRQRKPDRRTEPQTGPGPQTESESGSGPISDFETR